MLSGLLLVVTVISSISSSLNAEHAVVRNLETGTISHPLINHAAQLERRRRELRERRGAVGDEDGSGDASAPFRLPERPRTSRHSTTPSAASRLRSAGGDRALQQQMGALYQGYGTHYVDLWLGTPEPQRQTVIVDTGSGVTAFPCEECKKCGDDYHTDKGYKESKSQSFAVLGCSECMRGYCATMDGSKKCRISMSYAEGSSWSAYESRDLCYAGGPHDASLTIEGSQTNIEDVALDHIDPVDASQFAFELVFGCQVSITGLFITQLADGIMGMENEKTSFWKQMHGKDAIPRPEFSLCFSRQDVAKREGTGAGAMTLGGVDTRLHMSPMVFAKNQKGSGFYAVHLKGIYLRDGGGKSAGDVTSDASRLHKLSIDEGTLNRGNVIVDSGTTDTYFTSALAKPFKDAWKKLQGKAYSHTPVSLSHAEIDAMPTIVIVMQGCQGCAVVGDETDEDPDKVPNYVGGAFAEKYDAKDIVIAIPASHYMEFDSDTGKYVARFYTEESSGSVLGANAMMGHDIYFDTARGRVGFAESDCDYMRLVSEVGSISSPGHVSAAKTEVSPAEGEGGDESEEAVEPTDMEEEEIYAEVEEIMEEAQELEDEIAQEISLPELPTPEGDPEMGEGANNGEIFIPVPSPPLPPANDGKDEVDPDSYQLFNGNESPVQTHKKFGAGGGDVKGMAAEILDDMKHECSSGGCRLVAALSILAASVVVIILVRRTVARRRVVRQYQEAELEISDLALDSDDDDEHEGYVDEPPQIT